jgi:phosphoglucomutase
VDYQLQTRRNLQSGRIETLTLPKSNVIQLLMANGDRITARPSGTEPKIKYYFNTMGVRLDRERLTKHYQEVREDLRERVESYRQVLTGY